MKFMLDTNMCIYIIKRKPSEIIDRFRQTEISQIGISSITLSELLYGVSKSSKPEQNQIALTQFIAPLDIMAYGDDAASGRDILHQYVIVVAICGAGPVDACVTDHDWHVGNGQHVLCYLG